MLGYHKAEHGIAEELQSLVRLEVQVRTLAHV